MPPGWLPICLLPSFRHDACLWAVTKPLGLTLLRSDEQSVDHCKLVVLQMIPACASSRSRSGEYAVGVEGYPDPRLML